MNDMTPTMYCPADLVQKLDSDIHPWLLSEREGGNKTTLSYVKVDILTDTLNKLFGPLGWGVEAEIQKMEDFQYEKPGWNGGAATEMYVFQVISQVKLTIKPQTEAGSPTVFVQSGIGYGEVKVNGHRKDAVGMAVKGAESDGLKRCCNFLGRALGMFLVGGKQDPVVYAHNGNKNKNIVNRAMRDREDYEDRMSRGSRGDRDDRDDRGRQEESRGRDDGRRQQSRERDDRQRDDRQRDDDRQPAARDRDERPREQSSERQQDVGRARDDRQGTDAPRDRDEAQPARQERAKPADEQGANGADAGGDREPAQSRRRSTARSGGNADAAEKADGAEKGDGAPEEKGEVKGTRKANTNYDLRRMPVTRDNQKDFGATFIKQLEGMRQPEDQEQMVRNFAQRINELDGDIRALVVERLRERKIDVTLLD